PLLTPHTTGETLPSAAAILGDRYSHQPTGTGRKQFLVTPTDFETTTAIAKPNTTKSPSRLAIVLERMATLNCQFAAA
ncbi:hypothetical protein, partial [Alcanivorax jadensis]|uniref:hypothetical protein n=1 Tax=Alcanivorax jadensis TaxID=64988 RepID=UPI0023534E9A